MLGLTWKSEASFCCIIIIVHRPPDPADTRCDFGKKESILRLYLDVQLVTVEEPSSSLWFNSSQLQDAMPIIHKVTSTSTPDSAVDAGPASGCGPTYLHEEYNFFPGTENLLNHPTQGHHRLWYFYGFRPGAAGQPPDWSTAVCKLCGGPVALADTVGHLNLKHQISSQRFLRGQRIRNSVSSGKLCNHRSSPGSYLHCKTLLSSARV